MYDSAMSVSRRAFGLFSGAGLLSACAAGRVAPRHGIHVPSVRVAANRVTRVVVGLRPFRPQGYVVRAETLGDKRLVHNYGHGGAGITLSWGTAREAVDMGFEAGRAHAVIGCGAVGLATARLLQRRGAAVTVYAKDLPPETTSNIAGGHWWPTTVYDDDAVDDAFMQRFHRAVRVAYREFQPMLGAHYGVSWRRNYVISERPNPFGRFQESLRDVAPEMRLLDPGQHPFGNTWVQQYDSMMIEPSIYLQAVLEDFLTAGGRLEVRAFAAAEEFKALPESVIFNCTGLGAKALVNDDALMPIRGQLVVLLPQADLTCNLYARGGAYAFPRTDGLVLGGTFQRGNWDLAPDARDTGQILDKNARSFGYLRA